LQEITSDLQSMRDLAVESLNATNSGQDRADLNQQFQQLSADIDNVAKTASFNGVNLLDGSFSGATFQIGADAGQTVTVAAIASARTSALGQTYSATTTTAAATAALTAGELVINTDSVGATATDGVSFANGTFSGIAVANAINAANISGVSATANANTVTAAAASGAGPYTLAAGDLVINGINITGTAGAGTAETDTIGLINTQTTLTGVTASNNAGKIELTAADGRNITATATANGTLASGFATATATTVGTVTLTSTNTTAATAGIAISAAGSGISTVTQAASLNSGTVSNANILTVPASNSALATIDSALQSMAVHRCAARRVSESLQAADHGSEHRCDQPDQRAQRHSGYGLCAGDLAAVQGPDPAAGEHGDGGPGQYDPAERIDAVAETPVMIGESIRLKPAGRGPQGPRPLPFQESRTMSRFRVRHDIMTTTSATTAHRPVTTTTATTTPHHEFNHQQHSANPVIDREQQQRRRRRRLGHQCQQSGLAAGTGRRGAATGADRESDAGGHRPGLGAGNPAKRVVDFPIGFVIAGYAQRHSTLRRPPARSRQRLLPTQVHRPIRVPITLR
jgi:flagellin-like hook-associated protein FlgL